MGKISPASVRANYITERELFFVIQSGENGEEIFQKLKTGPNQCFALFYIPLSPKFGWPTLDHFRLDDNPSGIVVRNFPERRFWTPIQSRAGADRHPGN
jgi:hypothetical protein